MKVIIVDEERYFAETVQAFLEIEGFDVELFSDATSAYSHLSTMANIPRDFKVLVDVALNAGADHAMFSEARTERYLTTGIILVNELITRFPHWNARTDAIILYTAHYTTALWERILAFADPRSISVWQKKPNASGAEIVELVQTKV